MKRYKLIAAFAASMSFMTGCYELDVYPEDQLSSATFFKTQKHADQAMMGVYSTMVDDDVFGRQFGFDCLGGIGSGYDAAAYPTVAKGTYTNNEGLVSNKFKKLYEGIARANIVLQNIDACEMKDDLKKQYKAEAKFMRALFYFTLTDFWGGVPYYDETTVVVNDYMGMLKGKESLEKVRSYILADLDEAIAGLPKEWDNVNKGRATSGAALALKGKVLLYAATLPIVDGVKTGDPKYYDEAMACFKKLIPETNDPDYGGLYKLYEGGYENLFKPGGDESSEMIFAIQNIGGVGQDYGMPTTFYMGTRAAFGSCWNNVMASVDFVDSYEWKDGEEFKWTENHTIDGYTWNGYSTFDDVTETTNSEGKKEKHYQTREEVFYSEFAKKADGTTDPKTISKRPADMDKLIEMYDYRDPRMKVSVMLPYTKFKGWVNNKAKECEYVVSGQTGVANETNGFVRINGNYEWYPWRKFVAEEDMSGMINNRADTPINFPLIRLADVYLMLAECEIFSPTQQNLTEAANHINKVRGRVGVDMPAKSFTTQDEAFKALRKERAWELSAEGHSFSDMKRWGLLKELNGSVGGMATTKAYYKRVVTDRDYLWPFPLTEIDMNPALKEGQNPGW